MELSNRPYKAIIGWPYIQDKHIAIDGDGPLASFPQCTNQDLVPDQPPANLRSVSPLRLRRLPKELGPGCLGVAFFFNEADPIDFLEAKVTALSQADFAINEEVLKRPRVDPRTLLPKDYHDYLDLCTPYCKKPRTDWKFEINLKPDTNIHKDIGYSPLRRMSDYELREVKRILDEHRKAGNISPSSAPIASPVLFARKPNGTLRFCINYYWLNAVTEKDRYLLPCIDEVLRLVLGSKILSKIDIHQAFHGVEIEEQSRPLTTFRTTFGAWQWNVMPFGLLNASSTWQQVINDTLFERLGSCCCAYVDDIIIWSPSVEQHRRDVWTVLQRLRDEGLSINIEKCEFDVEETRYLGHILSTSDIRPDPPKVQALLDWPVPKTTKEVHQFHGSGSYYQGYIEGFARIAKPLTELMKKDAPFLWSPACQEAFNGLRSTLASAIMRHHFDLSLLTTVTTDAADGCLGPAMRQARLAGSSHPRPVAFISKTMIPAELNYFIHDKELLAIARALEEWEPELLSSQELFVVVTDHRALEYFMTKQKLNARQARWAEYLSRFNFKITYRLGCENWAADALSRRSPSTEHDEVHNVTLLPHGLFTSEALADLDTAVVAAGGDKIDEEEDDEEDDGEDGSDPIQELEAANWADTEEMTKLQELAKEGSPGYSVDARGLLRIADKVYVPEDPPRIAALLILHVHEQPSTGHPGHNRIVRLLSARFRVHLKNLAQRVAKYLKNCPVCCKLARHTGPPPLLRPLPVPDSPWCYISVDFVGPLPTSDGFNMIMVVVDWLTKMRHYIPFMAKEADSETSAPAMA